MNSIGGKILRVAAVTALLAAAPAVAEQPDAAAHAAWGFDRSDLAPHPGVRFGMLANGMRYALMPNREPAGALSIRLHVDVGSAVEGERELGFMHLIEHLIFEGTPNVSALGLPLMLNAAGLRRWTDFNAFTSYDETLYRLDLTRSDARARGTALSLMREISGNLSFDRRAVAGAKGMVRDEIAARDAVQDRLAAAQNAFFFPGSAIARGSVASTVANVKRARGAALQRLYRLHYVPERTTLILVGDFDPALAEREIAALFSGWASSGEEQASPGPSPAPSYALPARRTEVRLFVDRDASTTVTIAVTRPLGGSDAVGRRDAQFLEHLGSEMLNRRLARAAGGGPFTAADSAIYDHFSTGRLARIEATARSRDWAATLSSVQAELHRALEGGFSQAELDEQLAASREALARIAAPRTSPALADAIADAVGRGIVFTEPGDGAAARDYLARVRLADVNAALRAAWAGQDRLIFVSHHRPIAGGEAAIMRAWDAGLDAPADQSPGL